MSNKFDKQLIDRISARLVEFRAAIHAEIDEMVAEEVSGRLVAKALDEVKQRIEGGLRPVPPAVPPPTVVDPPAAVDPPVDVAQPAHPTAPGGH